jgi:hypothetical protein
MRHLLLICAVVALVGCGKKEPSPIAKANGAKPKKELTPEEKAVKATISRKSTNGLIYRSGPLKGGTAVLVGEKSSPFFGAYWVKDGTVHVANRIATTWSPNIRYPAGQKITYNMVKTSVR